MATRQELEGFYGVSTPHRDLSRHAHTLNVPRMMLVHGMVFMHRELVDATIHCFGHLRLIHLFNKIRGSLAPGFNAVKTFCVPGFIAVEGLRVHIRHRESGIRGRLDARLDFRFRVPGFLANVHPQP